MKKTFLLLGIILISLWGGYVHGEPQSTDSTESYSNTPTIEREKVNQLWQSLESKNKLDRRHVYMSVENVLLIRSILSNYEKETDPVNKWLIAIIGCELYPNSTQWEKRLVKNFPHIDAKTKKIQDENEMGEVSYILMPALGALGDIACKDEKAFSILLNLNCDGIMAEEQDNQICQVANRAPLLFLRHIKKLPQMNKDSALDSIAFTSAEFDIPFTRVCKKLVDNKDPELSKIASYSMKQIKKTLKEIETDVMR